MGSGDEKQREIIKQSPERDLSGHRGSVNENEGVALEESGSLIDGEQTKQAIMSDDTQRCYSFKRSMRPGSSGSTFCLQQALPIIQMVKIRTRGAGIGFCQL